jgi:Methyltransferase domain/galactosyl transferase GMA12/MNN10 family
MCPEISWDASSRFGGLGRGARRVLVRVLKPALIRQAAVDADLRGQLALQQRQIATLNAAVTAAGGAGDMGDLQYRVDVLERRYELAQARSLLPGATIPDEGQRITVVAHDWEPGEERRVLCSNATGTFASLIEVAALGLERYARRHRWDLVLSREQLSDGRPAPWGKLRLTRELLQAYPVVAWIDCDTIIVDFEHDLGEVLEEDKDFYVVEQEGGVPRDCVVNTGIFVARASEWTERFLDEVWSQEDLTDHRWWENAAIMRVLGYEIESSPVLRGEPTQWMERVKLIDLAWNSIPYWARSPRPRINHYGALAVPRRRLLMLDDLTQTIVKRRSSDPFVGVSSREDLPVLFNRLGFIGVGVEVGVQTGNYSAWILHRWAGTCLISVDPWASDEPDVYVDVANVEQGRHDALFVSTTHRLAPFGERSAIWRMAGEQAVTHVDDAALDFVYLDARHEEASIAQDLAMWAPKVRSGGIIAGHDYLDGDLPEGRFGVKTAVDRFFGARGVEIRETVADRPWSSWWIVQP